MVTNQLSMVKLRKMINKTLLFIIIYDGYHGKGRHLEFADLRNLSRVPLFTQIVSYLMITLGMIISLQCRRCF